MPKLYDDRSNGLYEKVLYQIDSGIKKGKGLALPLGTST